MLSLQNFPESARREHIFPELKYGSLFSVSQLFDQGCTFNFTADQVSVTLDKKHILTGPRDNNTGIWTFPLANTFLTQPNT